MAETEMHPIGQREMDIVRRLASVMKKKHGRHVDYDDLVGDGMVGLVRAAKAFDASKGANFRTYASRRIAGEMADGLRRMDMRARDDRRLHQRLEITGFDAPVMEGSSQSIGDLLPAAAVDVVSAIAVDELRGMCTTDLQREAFDAYLQGFTPTELAERDGLGRPCVSMRRHSLILGLKNKCTARSKR